MREKGGFTLIEVMIAAGLLSAVALLFSSLFFNSMRGERTVETAADLNRLYSEVSLILGDRNACTLSFAGVAPVAGGPAIIKRPTGTILAESQTSTPPKPGIVSVKWGPIVSTNPADPNHVLKFSELEIYTLKDMQANVGAPQKTKTFPIYLVFQPGSPPTQIESCYSGLSDEALLKQICNSLGYGPIWDDTRPVGEKCPLAEMACRAGGGIWDPANNPPCRKGESFDFYTATAGRRQTRSTNSMAGRKYDFCALSQVRLDGDNDNRYCRLASLGNGSWRVTAAVGNDPIAECTMICGYPSPGFALPPAGNNPSPTPNPDCSTLTTSAACAAARDTFNQPACRWEYNPVYSSLMPRSLPGSAQALRLAMLLSWISRESLAMPCSPADPSCLPPEPPPGPTPPPTPSPLPTPTPQPTPTGTPTPVGRCVGIDS